MIVVNILERSSCKNVPENVLMRMYQSILYYFVLDNILLMREKTTAFCDERRKRAINFFCYLRCFASTRC